MRTPRQRFADAERFSGLSQGLLTVHCDRMRTSEHAARGPFRLRERRHCLAEIVECGAVD